jgi:hypothetical protein
MAKKQPYIAKVALDMSFPSYAGSCGTIQLQAFATGALEIRIIGDHSVATPVADVPDWPLLWSVAARV